MYSFQWSLLLLMLRMTTYIKGRLKTRESWTNEHSHCQHLKRYKGRHFSRYFRKDIACRGKDTACKRKDSACYHKNWNDCCRMDALTHFSSSMCLFRSLQKENEAIKEFKSDLSSVNVELLKDSRLENQQLR